MTTRELCCFSDDHFKLGSDYTRAVFSPDAVYAVCGSNDGHLFVWNVISGKLETILKDGHRYVVGINTCIFFVARNFV